MARAKSKVRRKQRGLSVSLVIVTGLAALGLGFAVAQLSAPRPPEAVGSAVLAIGASAPSVALPATTGGTLSLDRLRGTKVVLYFYEGGG
jgi:hypothetical protein